MGAFCEKDVSLPVVVLSSASRRHPLVCWQVDSSEDIAPIRADLRSTGMLPPTGVWVTIFRFGSVSSQLASAEAAETIRR